MAFRGFKSCSCHAPWLTAYENMLILEGEVKHSIDIYQLVGLNPSSGGTHVPGGAYDIQQASPRAVQIAREMGAGAWERPKNWDGRNGIRHQHGVLNDCPHNSGGRYQIAALKVGRNGLGKNGMGGPDTGPNYREPLRTWREGVAWANKRVFYPEPRKAVSRKVYHNSDYALNDSRMGINLAKKQGYKWIDLNFQVTKDGRLVCTHWSRPLSHGWFDPEKILEKNMLVSQMTLAEVKRLRNKKHPKMVIKTAGEILKYANGRNMNVEFEAKNSPQFARADAWAKLDRVIRQHCTGIEVEVKMLSTFKICLAALAQAKASGRTTMILPRGSRRVPRSSWRYVDIRRGTPIWFGAVPKRKK